jgi:hypothetical protein
MGRGVWAGEGLRAYLSMGPISVYERALSLSELCQPTEEMAEQWGRALAQNTRRNSQTLYRLFWLTLHMAVSLRRRWHGRLIRKFHFVHQCRQEAGWREDFP